jgi:hypothetical protein
MISKLGPDPEDASGLGSCSLQSLSHLRFPISGSGSLADILGRMHRLQSLQLASCVVASGSTLAGNSKSACSSSDAGVAGFTSVVGVIASLPELRDLVLIDLPQWGEAASAALAAAT